MSTKAVKKSATAKKTTSAKSKAPSSKSSAKPASAKDVKGARSAKKATKKSAATKTPAKKAAKKVVSTKKPAPTKAAPKKRARYMDHDVEYTSKYIADILKSVKTIAMVGASSDPTKFSYGVLRVLHETGYNMIPLNPKEAGNEIRGLKVYEKLQDIDEPVDMVQVFRSSDALLGVAHDAVDIGAKVLWGQIGVRNDEAARVAEAAGMKVVMNRCPKIELFRPFWKPKLNQQI